MRAIGRLPNLIFTTVNFDLGGSSTMAMAIQTHELAEYLRVHPSTMYRLLRHGTLPALRIGSDWRFSREAIDRWRLAQLEPKL
jgi:excisionase family DNA binding protein